MSIHLQHVLLVALAVFGYIALHHFANTNGFWTLLEAAVKSKVSGHKFTTYKSIDDTCNLFVSFFYPLVSGDHPGLSLVSFVFAGQWTAGWTIMMMEAYRAGNHGRFISYISVFGLLYQSLGLGLCAPLYLLAHLTTSPTATDPTTQNLAISFFDLTGIAAGLLGGYIAPSIDMALASPYESKAKRILIWQLFPIWTSLITLVFSRLYRSLAPNSSAAFDVRIILRGLYTTVITTSAIAHISAMTLSVTPLIAPSLFNPAYATELEQAYLKFPPWPLDSRVKASSIAEGAFWFLQYDYILSSWALLIWSFSLRLAVVKQKSTSDSILRVATTFLKAVILGPMGASALLIWERDEPFMYGTEPGERGDEKKME